MRAAVYHGPEDIRVEELPRPAIGPEEVLLKVLNASICGTDIRIYHGHHRKFPPGTVRTPGHEMVGVVAELGHHVKGYTIGQRLFMAPNMGCGHCRQCISGNNNICANYDAIGVTIDGAFAEYLRVPAAAVLQGNLVPISEAVDPAVAALIEPFACVLRGQDAVSVHDGDTVLIMGAGPIGIMHVKLANLKGAIKVIVSEPIAERRQQALQLGADVVVDPVEEDLLAVVTAETGGRGADVIITAAPAHKAQEAALEATAIGGRINFFGGLPKDNPFIRFDSNLVHYKELVVTGTTACSTHDCLRAAELVNSDRLDLAPLISRRLPLEEAPAAFAAAQDRKLLKVVLVP
ncbi:MAG: alcohol dehydrogenase catalytic domain-containing protein [Chloroflexota bacterium]|nr:MAG: alcohol dehydrogenase catalytic domain-containing protein [Chloroflexota bacterium]